MKGFHCRANRLIFVALSVSILFSFMTTSLVAQNREFFRLEVYQDDTVALLYDLERSGFDILGRNGPGGFVEVIATPQQVSSLRSSGMKFRVVESSSGKGSRGIPAGYRDWLEHKAELLGFQAGHPEIALLSDAGIEYGVGTTHEDRQLLVMKISDNVHVDEDEPNILLTLNRHAREVTTAEYGLWIIENLTSLYGTDPAVTNWVDNYQIYIASCWNPDGFQYCFDYDEWWRKNRSPQAGGNFGVDLNRNYDFNWYGPYSGSTDPSSIIYKGPYPNSEQETKTEVALAQERRFAKTMDFHSYGQELVYTYYLSSSFPSALESYLKSEAEEIAFAFNYGGSHRKASAEGEAYQWELCNASTFSFLVETGTSFQPSHSTAQSEFADHIWPGVKHFLGRRIPLRGHVVEADTGVPIVADIEITGINYTQGEIRKTEPRFGSFQYFLPQGAYDITFSAAGYDPETFTVNIVGGRSTLLEVNLGQGPALTVNGNAAKGGLLDIDLDWAAGAGQIYYNGVSLTDTGFNFKNGVHVPIGWDFLYSITVGAFPGWNGTLDGSGHASTSLAIPNDPVVQGLLIYMAYFTMKPSNYAVTASSAAAKILIDS